MRVDLTFLADKVTVVAAAVTPPLAIVSDSPALTPSVGFIRVPFIEN